MSIRTPVESEVDEEVEDGREPEGEKLPFDIHAVIAAIRPAIEPYPMAAMFELSERGFGSVFQQLVGCILSIRTRDEVTLPVSLRLLEKAPTPGDMLALSVEEIDGLIQQVTFHEPKAAQIREIARQAVEAHGGELPCDRDLLMTFRGVGIKCANLVAGVACGQPYVSSDIHVHRVTNRWGYVATRTPEETTEVLTERLPGEYAIEINRLLVPFGKHICTGQAPKCSTCPVLQWCRQVGVTTHR